MYRNRNSKDACARARSAYAVRDAHGRRLAAKVSTILLHDIVHFTSAYTSHTYRLHIDIS
ncbi:hypothetical protein BDZ89DRAFT_1060661 [Hymenopellis radicata]|nr:hypothetical protein BDZ89DRAFT_1060661 [Hymenopellis radicata]